MGTILKVHQNCLLREIYLIHLGTTTVYVCWRATVCCMLSVQLRKQICMLQLGTFWDTLVQWATLCTHGLYPQNCLLTGTHLIHFRYTVYIHMLGKHSYIRILKDCILLYSFCTFFKANLHAIGTIWSTLA